MRRLWIIILALFLIFMNSSLAERTVYADQDGAAVFMEDGKVGLVDSHGDVILPAEYEWIEPFGENDYAVVSRDGLMGVVLRDGTFAVSSRIVYFYRLGDTGLAEVEYEGDDRSYLLEVKTGHVLHQGNR